MEILVKSQSEKEIIDLTKLINTKLSEAGAKNGVVTVFVKHTTASVTISEIGEGTEEDLLETVRKIIPKFPYKHAHNPSHAPDHLVSSIIGQSLSVPFKDGHLDLGTWQRIVVIELNGPRELLVTVTIV